VCCESIEDGDLGRCSCSLWQRGAKWKRKEVLLRKRETPVLVGSTSQTLSRISICERAAMNKLWCAFDGASAPARSKKGKPGIAVAQRPEEKDAEENGNIDSNTSMTSSLRRSLRGLGRKEKNFAETMDKVIPAVVVLQMNYMRAYEGNGRGSGGATGFVIDKKRGLILTNRHVVTGAPMRATALFQSKEEVPIYPVYADPIHDWGLFKFDTSKVRYQDVVEIPLAPERAKVGTEIRVTGNDAGEKLAILSGTLARLDRNAPLYGGTYSDHNTFYLSAASNTSGGSSGSPVVDIDGYAVGLNAGGAFLAASSFYYPLDRVVKALEYIKRGEIPPRRTIQTVFTHKSFVEVERLGLPQDVQSKMRGKFKKATGMLVVAEVIPESPAEKTGLLPGDVLVNMNGDLMHHFVELEDTVDYADEVAIEVRRGSKSLTMTIPTDDLHAMMPHEILEISDGVIHSLSYMQAVSSHRPPGSVVVAWPGYMFGRAGVMQNVIIKSVGDKSTPDVATFEKEIAQFNDLDQVSISFTNVMDKHRKQVKPCTIDRRWYPWTKRVKEFNGETYSWNEAPWEGLQSKTSTKTTKKDEVRTVEIFEGEDPRLCVVSFEAPVPILECEASSYIGTGVILDAKEGIVVCDRNTVPATLGNVSITIAGTVEIPGQVLMVHPMHNFSLVKYDPKRVELDLGELSLEIEAKEPSPVELKSGMKTKFVGFTHQMEQVSQIATVTLVKHMQSETSTLDMFGDLFGALFGSVGGGAKNQVVVQLDNNLNNIGGVLLDDEGRIQAFWFDFWGWKAGIPAEVIFDAASRFRAGEPLRSLAVELGTINTAKATSAMGLTDAWVREFAATSSLRHVLTITTVLIGSESEGKLETGDILLAIDDKPMTDFREVERATAEKDDVQVTVLRGLKEEVVELKTTLLPYSGTDQVVLWAGTILQHPPLDMAFRGFMPPETKGKGIFNAAVKSGSPAGLYGLPSGVFITGMNEDKVHDLASFLNAVSKLNHDEFVRIHVVTRDGMTDVFTLKTDEDYWETQELLYDAETFDWKFVNN